MGWRVGQLERTSSTALLGADGSRWTKSTMVSCVSVALSPRLRLLVSVAWSAEDLVSVAEGWNRSKNLGKAVDSGSVAYD